MFAVFNWTGLCVFRWNSGSLVGMIRREFGVPHYVMVVGTGDGARRIGDLLEKSESLRSAAARVSQDARERPARL